MSTTPINSWAIDLADVTHIYPWVGSEGWMTAIAIALWLLWHIWQVKHENAAYEEKVAKYGDETTLRDAISRHNQGFKVTIKRKERGLIYSWSSFFK